MEYYIIKIKLKYMMDILEMIYIMEKEELFIKMEIKNMMVNLKMVKKMVLENYILKMEKKNMKENLKMMKKMAILVKHIMVKNMEKEYYTKMEK